MLNNYKNNNSPLRRMPVKTHLFIKDNNTTEKTGKPEANYVSLCKKMSLRGQTDKLMRSIAPLDFSKGAK